jgi:aromatic-L-amino-acid/L-tryptophan decarboxylase
MDNPSSEPHPSELGDMPVDEFRAMGHRAIDWLADYLEHIEHQPVLSRARPGEPLSHFAAEAPERPTAMAEILEDFQRHVLPGITHWNHPGFMAYFGITASGPGILGELLAAGLNVNAMLWRTSPSATEMEQRALDWLRQMVGLPATFQGHIQDTASLSTLVALTAAREQAGLSVREEGLAGRDLPRLRIYCSAEAHSSVDRAAITIGLGHSSVRRVAVDDEFRMSIPALEREIERDRETGVHPVAVVATVGTTSSTSVDPVPAVADVCARHDLWLHVDGAYGGSAAVVPELRHLLAGVDRADSVVINPHKWLFVPIDCSALFLRDPARVRRAFSLVPEYLNAGEGDEVVNLMDYGPALGRRFRALKLWMVLRYFGREGIASRIREHCRLARRLASWIDSAAEWERLAPVPFSVVCFGFRPGGYPERELEALNRRIVDRVNASGEVFLSTTRLGDRFAIRVAVGNIRTTERHVARAWELLRQAADAETR